MNIGMILSVMQYNVLHGFHSESRPYILEDERLQAAREVVDEVDPDILVMNEACFAEPYRGIHVDYPRLFGRPHQAVARGAGEWATCILSRFPIRWSNNQSRYRRQFLRACLETGGGELMLDAVHPHPDLAEAEKRDFLREVVRTARPPYVLAGDLNACSSEDRYDRAELLAGFECFTPQAAAKVDDLLQCLAVRELLDRGLMDAYLAASPKKFGYTIPTDWLSRDKRSAVRIDHIFCSPDLTPLDAGIVQSSLTERASDHHPVYATFRLPFGPVPHESNLSNLR